MNIASATIAPNPVKVGSSVYIGVEIDEPETWLVESQELFLTTKTGEFLLTKEAIESGNA